MALVSTGDEDIRDRDPARIQDMAYHIAAYREAQRTGLVRVVNSDDPRFINMEPGFVTALQLHRTAIAVDAQLTRCKSKPPLFGLR